MPHAAPGVKPQLERHKQLGGLLLLPALHRHHALHVPVLNTTNQYEQTVCVLGEGQYSLRRRRRRHAVAILVAADDSDGLGVAYTRWREPTAADKDAMLQEDEGGRGGGGRTFFMEVCGLTACISSPVF